jgi:hypothetical protein
LDWGKVRRSREREKLRLLLLQILWGICSGAGRGNHFLGRGHIPCLWYEHKCVHWLGRLLRKRHHDRPPPNSYGRTQPDAGPDWEIKSTLCCFLRKVHVYWA